MRLLARLATATTTATITVAATVVGLSFATQANADPPSEVLGSVVEDGAYPGAATILATHGISVISGDGHLVVADCATAPVANVGLIRIHTVEAIGPEDAGLVCVKVLAPAGYLKLTVPGVYEIRGDGQTSGTGHSVTADLTTSDGVHTTVAVNPSGSTPVGIGASPDNDETTLLRLSTGQGMAPVTGSAAAVGKLDTDGRTCTGTLVHRLWVLTAASCFSANVDEPNLAKGPPARPAQIVFPGHAGVAITSVTPRTDRDLVLAQLATPIQDIVPAKLATSSSAVNATLQSIVYGRTATEWVTDQQQSATVAVTSTSDTALAALTTSGRVCKGAAGGPAFNSGNEIVAIHSRAGQGGCLDAATTRTDIVQARVDNITDWISSETAAPSAAQTTMVFGGYGHVFATGADGHLKHWFATPGANFWSLDESLSQVSVVGSPTTMVFGGYGHVFVTGTDGHVKHWFATPGGYFWSFDESLSQVSVVGSPTTMVFGNLGHVFAVGSDGHLKHWLAGAGDQSWGFDNSMNNATLAVV